jgi:hypothetical protein
MTASERTIESGVVYPESRPYFLNRSRRIRLNGI